MAIASWGLIANACGAVLIGIGQYGVTRTVRMWLMALQVAVLSGGTAVITGTDVHMDAAVQRDKWLSAIGWIVMLGGYVLQLISK